ncbi:MAG: hypothetical protein A2017_21800 [Lentisphaerae bacterium GWF2_44_16]|nr:MAG: hypothetical protein A2017_21800 [Lentisphaerae bacterium GWF2_44_16]
MSNPVIMHVNYMEQGQSIKRICRKAVEWGYDGVEFRRKKQGYTQEAYLDEIAGEAEASRLENILFSFGPELMQPDMEERKKSLDEIMNFFDAASKKFELKICNAFAGDLLDKSSSYMEYDKQGSAIAAPEQWKWAAEGFKTIGKFADEAGFKIAFETHMCYIHDLHTSARKLVDMINMKSVGINLDYCNIIHFPEQPSLKDVIDVCGEKIYYVHLKNILKIPEKTYNNSIRYSLSGGIINNREFLRILKTRGYTGMIALEAPRPGDRECFAKEDIEYIKKVMKDLEEEE